MTAKQPKEAYFDTVNEMIQGNSGALTGVGDVVKIYEDSLQEAEVRLAKHQASTVQPAEGEDLMIAIENSIRETKKLQDEVADIQKRIELAKRSVVLPYKTSDLLAKYREALKIYKDEVVEPAKEKLREAKEAYERAIEDLKDAQAVANRYADKISIQHERVNNKSLLGLKQSYIERDLFTEETYKRNLGRWL